MIHKLQHTLETLRRDERGMTTVEYAIVLCLVAALAVGAWNTFGGHIKDRLVDADGTINDTLQGPANGNASGNGGN